MTRLPQTPSQTVGPFFSIGLCREPRAADSARLGSPERLLGSDREVAAFLLGQRGVNVQHERVDVGPQFGDDEGNTA